MRAFPGLAALGLTVGGLLCGLGVAGPAAAAGAFDGTYRGAQVTIRSNNSTACQRMDRDDVVIRIVDNHFTRNWGKQNNGGDTIELDVKPDGSFSGTTASLSDRGRRRGPASFTMSGQITGGVLVGEIGSSLCAVKMTLKKS